MDKADINSGNTCCRLVQMLLPSLLLSKRRGQTQSRLSAPADSKNTRGRGTLPADMGGAGGGKYRENAKII